MSTAEIIAAKIANGSLNTEHLASVPPESFKDFKFIEAVTIAATLVMGEDEPDQLEPLFNSTLYRHGLAQHVQTPTSNQMPLIDRLEIPLKTAVRDAHPRKKAAMERILLKLFSDQDLQQHFSPNMLHVLGQAFPNFQAADGSKLRE